jgi:hypothetical protein
MQPVQNLLLLTYTRVPQPALPIFPTSMSERSFRAVSIRLAIVRFFPAAADEEHVTDLDVAALSCGTNVDALVLAALVQLFPGDGVVVEGIVVDALLAGVAAVVEQDAAACDAVVGPVVDGALVVCGGAEDVGAFGLDTALVVALQTIVQHVYAIVERPGWTMGEMPEAIPLRA